MNQREKKELHSLYLKLDWERQRKGLYNTEDYDTGYRYGHINGQVELLEKILDIYGIEKKKKEKEKEKIRIKKERRKKGEK